MRLVSLPPQNMVNVQSATATDSLSHKGEHTHDFADPRNHTRSFRSNVVLATTESSTRITIDIWNDADGENSACFNIASDAVITGTCRM
jgi:hypothetical protein